MSAKWEGFTDDDLKKLTGKECMTEGKRPLSEIRVAKKQIQQVQSSGKKNVTREWMLQKRPGSPPPESKAMVCDIPEQALFCKPKKKTETVGTMENLPLISEGKVSNGVASPLSDNAKPSSTDASPSHGPVFLRIKEGKNYEVFSSDKTPLDEFQTRHRLMEEQNRRRKELLAKALADRKKQTREEARRLQQIQDELQKLDLRLSNDVSILRNHIEAASFEFMEAQKRYNKAEKEFLDAKLYMFGKLERKELLTEHLCTIIEQNEMRKARKLSELMDKLELGATLEGVDDDDDDDCRKKDTAGLSSILSPLRALDEAPYSGCNTLKSRSKDLPTSPEDNPAVSLEHLESPVVELHLLAAEAGVGSGPEPNVTVEG